jgi:putative phage-type endonuclease
MNVLDCEQGSAAWFEARLGCVTSSRVADAIAKLKRKDGESAARRNLRYEILCEMLTQKPSEHFVSRWMEEGKENEPLARTAYELERNVIVEQIGFAYHNTIKMAGASPDGLVNHDGLIEIKCPKTSTHIEYLINAAVPEDYKPQMYWQMACCDRSWCDFVSYDPRLPEDMQLLIVRLPRSNQVIEQMEKDVSEFLAEVEQMMTALKPAGALRKTLMQLQKAKALEASLYV